MAPRDRLCRKRGLLPASRFRQGSAMAIYRVLPRERMVEAAFGDPRVGVALTAAAVPLWMRLSLLEECRGRVERALAALGAGAGGDARHGYCQLRRPWYARCVGGAAAPVGRFSARLLCCPAPTERAAKGCPGSAKLTMPLILMASAAPGAPLRLS
jgi:hypothetical protein